MTREAQPTIWLIDENKRELRLHAAILKKALSTESSEISIETLLARPHIGDYLDILRDPRTVAIVVDQRLNEVSGIDHTGIELAKRLRALAPKLPIYILTNYPSSDDFVGEEWSVEDILPKDDMHQPDRLKTFIARLLRHIDVHQSILAARDARFRDLLRKSLEHELVQDEQRELDELQFERTAVIVADEADKLKRLESALADLKRYRDSF